MRFRFAVGTLNGPRSASWKLWTQGDEAYLVWRKFGHVDKFSFHNSGICRWAYTQSSPRPAIRSWKYEPVPAAGALTGSPIMRLAFPTDHLSTAFADRPGSIKWIDPAPPEMALGIELYLIRDTEYEIRKAFAKEKQRTLLALGPLRGGVNLLVRSTHFECGPVEVHLPGNPPAPGKVFGDLVFPEIDTEGTGRPVRMLLPMPRGNPPVFWELGGYEARPLEAFGRE